MSRFIACFLGAVAALIMLFGFTGTSAAQQGEWGAVKGRVIWGPKEIPKPQTIAVDKNPDKDACLKAGPLMTEKWVINEKNKGLKWTFVWLAPAKADSKLPIHPDLLKPDKDEVVIDQPVCRFIPHAIGMREGQTLIAKNGMMIAHNFKWTGNPATKNAGNNVLIAGGGSVPIKGLVADRLPVRLECNIHPWMSGWLRIFDHPYFAVTDADGKFEFKNAPAGEYRLMVWHGSGGWLGGAAGKNGQPITIGAGQTKDTGELKYQPPAED